MLAPKAMGPSPAASRSSSPVERGGGELVGGVRGEVFVPGAGFERDNVQAGGGEFGEYGSAAGAGADDDGVDEVGFGKVLHGGAKASELIHAVGGSVAGVRVIWVKPAGSSAKPVKPMRA